MKRKAGLKASLERATYDKVALQRKMLQIRKGMDEVISILEKPRNNKGKK